MKHATKNQFRFARSSRWGLIGLTATAALSLLVHRADAAVSLVITPDGDGRGVVATWGSGAFPHTGPNQSGSWQGPDGTTFSFGSGVFSEFFGDFYSASVQGNVAGSGYFSLEFFGGEPNTGTGNLTFGPNGSYDLSHSYENLGTVAAPVWSGQYTLRSAAVPEPTAPTLLGLGLAGFLMARRRK
jgi:hypothetical protein